MSYYCSVVVSVGVVVVVGGGGVIFLVVVFHIVGKRWRKIAWYCPSSLQLLLIIVFGVFL